MKRVVFLAVVGLSLLGFVCAGCGDAPGEPLAPVADITPPLAIAPSPDTPSHEARIQKALAITRGMTVEQVVAILGEPDWTGQVFYSAYGSAPGKSYAYRIIERELELQVTFHGVYAKEAEVEYMDAAEFARLTEPMRNRDTSKTSLGTVNFGALNVPEPAPPTGKIKVRVRSAADTIINENVVEIRWTNGRCGEAHRVLAAPVR